MKALSLWQPWADAIVHGLKRIETRSWSTSYRGPLLIHAARRMPPPRRGEFADLYEILRNGGRTRDQLVRGAVIGVALLRDVVPVEEVRDGLSLQEEALGDYSPGRLAWVFERAAPLTPIFVRGFQGIFEVSVPRSSVDAALAKGPPA